LVDYRAVGGRELHHNVTDDDSRLKGCCRIRIAILCLMQ
jgi:hypothetical protein